MCLRKVLKPKVLKHLKFCRSRKDKGVYMGIHVLDSRTIDRIAAGEVVERPASVVKELVENAIDAGSTAITVEAKEGGIEFIRVTDNGCGIEREQLPTAFLRHATSKIEDADDLNHIASLGFRGEALSSIAAVSRVEIITKRKENLTGTRMVLEGAREQSIDEIGAPDGTTFLMRNLFFNTPVRRKFLKQPATEGSYITDLMEHLALSRPDISFKFVLGNQTRFHTSGNGDLREVIYRIYGREIAAELVPIQIEENGIKVEGYLGKPVLVRSNRNFEIYFINGRFIRSGVIAKAIEEGYKQYLMQHKFPLCVLHITMDTETVDVNVHPSKMDVRFSDGIAFARMLSEKIATTLRNREMIPDASLEDEKAIQKKELEDRKASWKEHTPEVFEKKREESYRVMEAAKYEAAPKDRREFIQKPIWQENHTGVQTSIRKPESLGKTANDAAGTATAERPQDILPGTTTETSKAVGTTLPQEDDFFVEAVPPEETKNPAQNQEQTATAAVPGQPAAPSQEASAEPEPEVKNAQQLNLFEEKLLSMQNRSRYRIIGQVFDTYWMIQFEDKLFIIDQHAAHEKVKYERLMKQFHEKSVVSQRLMPPIIVSLTGQEESILHTYEDAFAQLGFEIEAFGGNEYALRSVPVDLYGCSERELFLAVLDELSQETGSRGSFQVIEEKIASMSCKAAVKGNNRLSFQEAEELIDELLTLDNPYNCPHGRPTIITMTETDLEKKFKRIV